ncbi:MAG TPA: GH32 C-terminal domain-containing protein [Bacilli bacterium]
MAAHDINGNLDGLVAYWTLDEGQGKQVKESISGSYDPIDYVFNNARFKPDSDPLWGKGVNNHALLFDGYSTWITHSSNLFNKPINALTIEAWVAPRSYEWAYDDRLAAIVNQHDRETKQGFILGLYRHGQWSLQAGINGNWVEVWAEQDPLPKGKWSHIAATFDHDLGRLNLYLNGRKVSSNEIPQNSTIAPANEPLIIGKNNQAAKINEAFSANMFNGMIDEVKIYNQALSQQDIRTKYQLCLNAWNGELPAPNMEMKRSRFKGDRHRPQYHFIAPGHWMNEPHAPLYFNGQYHLFFQHNPQGPYFNHIHWGHAVSSDLVHWRDLPIALAPEADKVDPFGDWTGCSVIDDNGSPVLIFTAADNSKSSISMSAMAKSTYSLDGDNDLKEWVKHPSPITVQETGLKCVDGEILPNQFRDPFVWKEGNTWYQVIGSGIKKGTAYVSGTALLYTSSNLIDWTYRKPLYVSDFNKYPKTGHVWELPVFLPLGTNKHGVEKHILLINPSYEEYSPHNIKYVWYWIGRWDRDNYSFIPDHEEPELTDVGEHFTGPSGLIDPQGRLLIFSIAQGKRTIQAEYDAGWAHNGGLPVQIYLRTDERLGIEPVVELRSLRGTSLISIHSDMNFEEANQLLANVSGDNLEIELELDFGKAKECGIVLRRSPGGEEQTILYYNKATQEFLVNRNQSSMANDVEKGIQGGFVDLKEENLKLLIYLDRSMIEAYANGLKGLTTRVYPTKDDALGLQLWGSDLTQTMIVKKLNIWTLGSAYD